MIVTIDPGQITVSDADEILGHSDTLALTPAATRDLAEQLEQEGKHTIAAEGLRRAANQADGR